MGYERKKVGGSKQAECKHACARTSVSRLHCDNVTRGIEVCGGVTLDEALSHVGRDVATTQSLETSHEDQSQSRDTLVHWKTNYVLVKDE